MTLKQFVFKEMENKGYVLDGEVAKFLGGKKTNYYTVEVYKREYQNLERAKENFNELENKVIHKGKRKYFLRNRNWEHSGWSPIPKIYFDYLVKNKMAQVV